jgi:nucleoside-diphosphate-sugar epimerase
MKRVLVTGADGFLGRNVLVALLRRGFEVHALCHRQPHPALTQGVRCHRADVLARSGVREVLESIRPYALLHLAWDTKHGTYWKSVANLEWTVASLHLLQEFAAAGGQRVVIAGTSAEYRWGGHLPLDESHSLLQPDTFYGTCKNALRQIVQSWAPIAGVSWAWGRIFNIFGPDEKSQRLVPKIIHTLMAGKPLPFDDGLLLRDFLHVADAGDAFAALLASEVQGPVNIASGQPTSIRDLVSMIANHLDALELVSFGAVPVQGAQPARVVATIARLRDEVGWQPPADLAQRVQETCDWWRATERQSVGSL